MKIYLLFIVSCITFEIQSTFTRSLNQTQSACKKSSATPHKELIETPKICEEEKKQIVAQSSTIAEQPSAKELNATSKSCEKKEEKATIQPITAQKKTRTIEVKNSITPDMITYKKHWTGHHKPSNLSITFNDNQKWLFTDKKSAKISPPAPSQLVTVNDDDTIKVTLNYTFKKAGITYKKDSKTYTCKVSPSDNLLDMSFTWEGDQKVILEAKSPQNSGTLRLTALNN